MEKEEGLDRRVARTRRMLREALIALILERGWDAITVMDVCERADVGRSTFYAHFADKEELLVGGFEDLRKALRAQLRARGTDGAPLAFAGGLLAHAEENRRVFRAIVGKHSGHVVVKRFTELVVGLVREDLQRLAPAGPAREAATHYLAGAFMQLLVWWVDSRSALEPGQVEALYQQLSRPVLAQAGGLPPG